jgi:glycosyltransferase involved in cell wall biosynthesis
MLDSDERIGALRDADIFILTSHSENFAIAAAEAMAAGVPVLVSDRVGIAAEILKWDAGFVTSLDATEIAIVLRRLFADAELRQRLGRNAARLVRDMYAPHLIARKIGTNLQRIAALRGRKHPEIPCGSPKPLSGIIPSDRM